MTKRSRLLLAAASLALLAVYIVPLWSISLDAPQYPEGLGIYIRVDSITGHNQGNLESINALNHYIGMKHIKPDDIPELKILPWIFAGLIAFGLIAAAAGRRWLLYTWVGLFAIVMVGSLVDFYLWGYDYGHNLDHEHAIIKVPGLTYQPPLIGFKQMLNIKASSWPWIGGIIAALSFGMGAYLSYVEFKGRRAARPGSGTLSVAAGLAMLAVFGAGCSDGPKPIRYGHDACTHCRMTITDRRFGAEMILKTGKVYTYDSIECLASHLADNTGLQSKARALYVVSYDRPESLLPIEEVTYVQSKALTSPMGMNLAAFVDHPADEFTAGGRVLAWSDIQKLVQPIATAGAGHQH